MKKLIAILLTMILVLSFGAAAFAEETEYSITITNAKEGETYTAYKLFDLSVNDPQNPTAYTYSVIAAWKDFQTDPAFLAAFGEPAFAQDNGGGYVPTPVTVSQEKVKLNGKIYLSHVVLERQTLFGIAKAYGVSVEEIYEANPSLRETGLQKNAIILIPFKEGAAAAASAASSTAQAGPQESGSRAAFIEHTVRWYEDLDDIARKYGVSAKDIMEANGLKSKKLQTRQVLKIPVRGAEPEDDGDEKDHELTEEAQEGPVTAGEQAD